MPLQASGSNDGCISSPRGRRIAKRIRRGATTVQRDHQTGDERIATADGAGKIYFRRLGVPGATGISQNGSAPAQRNGGDRHTTGQQLSSRTGCISHGLDIATQKRGGFSGMRRDPS